jgi:hypothetical protein
MSRWFVEISTGRREVAWRWTPYYSLRETAGGNRTLTLHWLAVWAEVKWR